MQTILREGITHIEDLPLNDFIHAVETLKEKTVTEKLDGSNLWFGVDEKGFFTSREGKSKRAARFRTINDYPQVAAYNGFRGAHEALARHADTIKRHLQSGDMVETEVLFGRQPNTVTYGNDDKNFIVILRGIETDQKKVDSLAKALNGKHSSIKSTVITSDDGENLKKEPVQQHWEFTQVKPLDTKAVDLSPAMAKLSELKKYMAQPNTKVPGKTNQEVAELSLNKVPKEQRDAAKAERETQLAFMLKNFKQPIKKFLLDALVRKVKPFLQTKDVHPDEDIGVEGVVASDKKGNMIKIVDKDMFTAINKFNNLIRSNIAGLVRTDDQDAPIEMRGGAFGQAKIRIANLLGMKELALSSNSRKILEKFKGADAAETATNLASNINLTSFESARKKVSAILDNALEDIDEILQTFKDNADTYKLKLETGKEIGISPEVMKRTLTAFAEAKRDINQVNTAVAKSSDLPEMIMALYGRTIQGLFSGDQEVKESKFSMLKAFESSSTPRWFIVSKAGVNLTAHTSMPYFTDEDAANTYKKKFAHSQAIKDGQVVKGTADHNGYVTPINEDEGGAEAAADGTTSAADIAPVEKRLMGGRMITRRPRKFMKKKRFAQVKEGKSLLKMFEFDMAADVKNQFAKDVDDTAAAKNDVEFKSLRNQMKASGDEATTQDVTNYLDKAHELNDEVDTVTFGMEMDDGSVVKVYVNASEADAFEKALSDMLGEEDDIETVIDELANNFDIVDVEWPGGADGASDDALVAVDHDNEITGDSEVPSEDGEIGSATDADGEEQISPVIDLSPDGGGEGGGETTDGEEESEGGSSLLKQADADADAADDEGPDLSVMGDDEPEAGGEDTPPEDDTSSDDESGADTSTEPMPDDEPTLDEPTTDEPESSEDEGGADLGDMEPEDSEDESQDDTGDDDTSPDDDGNGGGKKKKKKKVDDTDSAPTDETDSIETKESNMSIGQRFKDKLLAEKAAPKGKEKKKDEEVAPEEQHEFPEQLKKLMVEFPNPGAKMMVGLMYMLGVPLDAMVMKKAELKKSVDAAGDQYMKDSQLRMWVKKVITSIKDAQSSGVKEGLEAELTSQYQKTILAILGKIGLTDGIEKIARSALRAGVKATAALAQTDNKVRANLKVLADMFGIDTATGNVTEAKNHLGNKEYNTWAGWRAAVKKAAADADLGTVWFDGDKDISQALVGANPYKQGKSFSIGEWDGEKGDVNQSADLADTKKRMSKVDEATASVQVDRNGKQVGKDAPETGIDGFIDDVKQLAIALGIPEGNVKYREPQVNLAVRKTRSGIKNISSVQLQMKRLMKLLGME